MDVHASASNNTSVITAIDTNVIVTLWRSDVASSEHVSTVLDWANAEGLLIIAPAVYGELLADPNHDSASLDTFLHDTSIHVTWNLEQPVWRTAGLAYRAYTERRRAQQSGQGPRRILTDFIIGAHALHHASALLTFDERIYREGFPTLTVIAP